MKEIYRFSLIKEEHGNRDKRYGEQEMGNLRLCLFVNGLKKPSGSWRRQLPDLYKYFKISKLPGNVYRTFFADHGYADLSGIGHFGLNFLGNIK